MKTIVETYSLRIVSVKVPAKTRMTKEGEYGNQTIYAEIHNPASAQATFAVEYAVTRREYSRSEYAQLEKEDHQPALVPASMSRLVATDTLIPTKGKIGELGAEITGSQSGTVAKAKAAYDYFFTTMRYDKTGAGWGRGDALWSCDVKRGNFVYPYVEIDGKTYDKLDKHFGFEEMKPSIR